MVISEDEIYNLYSHYIELCNKLESLNDCRSDEWIAINKEISQLNPFVEAFEKYKNLKTSLVELDQIETENDLALVELIKKEKEELTEAIKKEFNILKTFFISKSEEYPTDCILEIRAGVGGDEASLFAETLFNMYNIFCTKHNIKLNIISVTKSACNGIKEIICELSGTEAYKFLQFESGGHRVQRVPETETKGRVHTSTVTVVVMPKITNEIKDNLIRPDEIKIDVFRASGKGGQHINKTESAVRITHIPTGIVVTCQNERSQFQNKMQAFTILHARLKEYYSEQSIKEVSETRKDLAGSGNRNDKIRTYNFPQDRITDHRINFSIHGIYKVLSGNLDPILKELLEKLEDNV